MVILKKGKNIKEFIKEIKINFKNKKVKNNINLNNLYLWEILHMTTFGQLIKLLDYLNKDIKNLVLNHFAKINQKLNVNYYQLISLMNIFKKIRNIICHNSIILNYELMAPNRKSKYYENISNFIFDNKLDIKIKKTIKLTDIIVIISFINEYNSTKKTLLEIFVDTLNTFINNETFDYKLVKKIKKNIKF